MTEYTKMSKKQKKEINNKKRITWESSFGRSMPRPYISKNKKSYSRKEKHKTPFV